MTQTALPDFDLPARGNVKAAMKSAAARSADLWQVRPSQLHVMDGFNVRVHSPEYDAHIESLTTSIIENGYFSDRPIAGYVARENGENTIYVTDGHSRLEAVNRAIDRGHAIETIPVIIKPQGTSIEDLTVALVKSNEGRPLGPLEVGAVCKRLMGLGLDEGAIAKRLGFTRGYVNDLLMLVGSAKPLRDLVVEGKVAATLAIEQLKQDPETAQDVLQHAVEQAQAMGKQKATKKHLPKPDVPPKATQPRSTAEQTVSPARAVEGIRRIFKGAVSAEIECANIEFSDLGDPEDPISQGGLWYAVRLDDYIEALLDLRRRCCAADEKVPAQTPNENGVFIEPEIIRSPREQGQQHIDINLAKSDAGWRYSLDYWLVQGGGGSLPGVHDQPYNTRHAAMCVAVRKAEELILDALAHREASLTNVRAIRKIHQWLGHLNIHTDAV